MELLVHVLLPYQHAWTLPGPHISPLPLPHTKASHQPPPLSVEMKLPTLLMLRYRGWEARPLDCSGIPILPLTKLMQYYIVAARDLARLETPDEPHEERSYRMDACGA